MLHAANKCTAFEVSSFSRSRDISRGVKFENVSRDLDHTSLRADLSSTGRGLLP